MKKIMLLGVVCCMMFGLVACGSKSKDDIGTKPETTEEASMEASAEATTEAVTEATVDATTEAQAAVDTEADNNLVTDNSTSAITEDQALEAIKKYCIANNPDLKDMVNSGEQTIYWEVGTKGKEIVVLYRSYTGAMIRYYVNPDTGDTYATEQVPGIIDEEQKNGETLNVKDYM